MEGAAAAAGLIVFFLYLAVILATVAGMWAVYAKAGQPGWAAIIPIYNIYVLTQIAGKPAWWTVLALLPCVNIIILFILQMEVAKAFGKGLGYAVGLFLLSFVFWPMLGFGDAKYQGASAA